MGLYIKTIVFSILLKRIKATIFANFNLAMLCYSSIKISFARTKDETQTIKACSGNSRWCWSHN